jgi:hypothetical protein
MSKKMSLLPTLPEGIVLDNDDIVPRDASHSDIEVMKDAAKTGKLDDFEKMFKLFNPTEQIWEMRMFANAFAKDMHSRQFQRCLQVANEMRANRFQPTVRMQKALTKICKSPQQRKIVEEEGLLWLEPASTIASNGGRSKRRQIHTRARARLNKSKKCRGRRLRQTRKNYKN